MKINLEELEHQRNAITAILREFPERDYQTLKDMHGILNTDANANPMLVSAYDESQFIDVKMETGTGKTYVYTRMMYELNKERGLSKFVVVVPSLAIKAGARDFMMSDYAKQHFSQFFPNKQLIVYQLGAGDFAKKSGRHQASNDLVMFTRAMTTEKNTIHVLLMSDKGFLDRKETSLFKNHYDQNWIGSAQTPAEAILMTRPVVIIDEPHRFKKDGNTYQNIIEKIDPPMIVRFGATFPEITVGKGKNKITKTDYYSQPVYDLNAIDSFNQGLVKGVEVIYPDLREVDNKIYRVKSVAAKKLVLVCEKQEFEIRIGENLSVALSDMSFDGDITYEGAFEGNKNSLSNGLELSAGKELIAGTFNNSYQIMMLQHMIDEHFDKEQEYFLRDGYRIKTISLAFIDSIDSYRNNDGWLRVNFERILQLKLDELLIKYQNPLDERETEYYNYLLVTKTSLNSEKQLVHGGYFAKDWGEADDSAVANEREDILRKERTLSFKNERGEWNLRRFFFSKWTLREGWDNPNVFVIAKLRSSGSEISKLQEVGRGLRLPVNEVGGRVANEELKMSYIIDYSEADFANRLVGEINADTKIPVVNGEKISDIVMALLRDNNYAENDFAVYGKLMNVGLINGDLQVIDADGLRKLLPMTGLKSGIVTVRPNAKKNDLIAKLRTNNWQQIADFWQEIARRYMIRYQNLTDSELDELLLAVAKEDFLINPTALTTRKTVVQDTNEQMVVREAHGNNYQVELKFSQVNYGEFLARIAKITNLSVKTLHVMMVKKLATKDDPTKWINMQSIASFKRVWDAKFRECFGSKHSYDALSFTTNTSILKNGDFARSIKLGDVGINVADNLVDDERNLFELPLAYDSTVEHEIMKFTPDDNIVIFGKIPRRAIKIPTFTGGTTTPDFIYVTRNKMNLLIEAKSDDLRESEAVAVAAQQALLEKFPQTNWIKATTQEQVRIELAKFTNK